MHATTVNVCVCVYIYIFLNITYWVHTMLLGCMFSRLIFWHQITYWYTLSWGELVVFHVGLRPFGIIPIQLGISISVILVQLIFDEILWIQFWVILGGTTSWHIPDPVSLTTFPSPVLKCSLSLRCRSVQQIYPLELGFTTMTIDWLQLIPEDNMQDSKEGVIRSPTSNDGYELYQ